MKKVTSLNIDEDILKYARKEIPNLSEFVENCIKIYLNIDEEGSDFKSIEGYLNTIKDARLKIHLLSENDFNDRILKKFDSKKQNEIWLKIWGTYRNTNTYNESDLLKSSEILEVSVDFLKEMLHDLKMYSDKSDLTSINDWSVALEKFKEL